VKRRKFTEQQIAFALKQAQLGPSVEEVCRKCRRRSLRDCLKRFAKHCRVRPAHQYRRMSTGARGAPYLTSKRKLL
jgi:hypothetical protein